MIVDSQEMFSAGQAVTATGDTVSTNVLDTGSQADDGIGFNPWINVMATTQATSAGAATVQAVFQTSPDNATWTDVLLGAAFPVAQLTPGKVMLQGKLPTGLRRYLRVVYRVGTAALTGGTFTAFHSMDIQANVPYTSGFYVA